MRNRSRLSQRVTANVFRIGVHRQPRVRDVELVAVGPGWDPEPELAGNDDVVAATLERCADERLVVRVAPIAVRRVDEGGAGIGCHEQCQRGIGVGDRSVEAGDRTIAPKPTAGTAS